MTLQTSESSLADLQHELAELTALQQQRWEEARQLELPRLAAIVATHSGSTLNGDYHTWRTKDLAVHYARQGPSIKVYFQDTCVLNSQHKTYIPGPWVGIVQAAAAEVEKCRILREEESLRNEIATLKNQLGL